MPVILGHGVIMSDLKVSFNLIFCCFKAQVETQRAALRFERAMSMHEAAKEMVQLAEQGYMNKGEPFDPAWQEMLNHATMKVDNADR